MERIIMLTVNDSCGYCGTFSNMDTARAFVKTRECASRLPKEQEEAP